MREVGQNQDEIEKRVSEYAFKQTETDREINGKGELKKQTVKVYEVYPLPNREPVQKLISENGVPLSAGARGERRSARAGRVSQGRTREREGREEGGRNAAPSAKRSKRRKEGTEISPFLKACEFVSPRREMFGRPRDDRFRFPAASGIPSKEPRREFDCEVDRCGVDRSGR